MLGAQLLGQRHGPHQFAGAVGGGLERAGDAVRTHDPGRAVAEGNKLRAGERGDVDDGVGVFAACGDDSIGHDQAAFGVGVQHLNGLAAEHGEDVGRAGSRAAGHVFGDAQPCRCFHGQAKAVRSPAQC